LNVSESILFVIETKLYFWTFLLDSLLGSTIDYERLAQKILKDFPVWLILLFEIFSIQPCSWVCRHCLYLSSTPSRPSLSGHWIYWKSDQENSAANLIINRTLSTQVRKKPETPDLVETFFSFWNEKIM
jgi:hypothetical protein